jgi:Ca2+-binding RTX toxin-like protein
LGRTEVDKVLVDHPKLKFVNDIPVGELKAMEPRARLQRLADTSEKLLKKYQFVVDAAGQVVRAGRAGQIALTAAEAAAGAQLVDGNRFHQLQRFARKVAASAAASSFNSLSEGEQFAALVGHEAVEAGAAASKGKVKDKMIRVFKKYLPKLLPSVAVVGVAAQLKAYQECGEKLAEAMQALANGQDVEDVQAMLTDFRDNLVGELTMEVVAGALAALFLGAGLGGALAAGVGLLLALLVIHVVQGILDGAVGDYLQRFKDVLEQLEEEYAEGEARQEAALAGGRAPDLPGTTAGSGQGAKEDAEDSDPKPKDPLVIDVDGDGFAPTGLADGAYFDLDRDGFAERVNWVSDGDVILVWDRDGDGQIRDGNEVFGSTTSMAAGGVAASGFDALAGLDSNEDGLIDPWDDVWPELAVWDDARNRGVADTGELVSLTEAGIESISLDHATSSQVTDAGVVIGETSLVALADGGTGFAGEYWVSAQAWDTVELVDDSEAGIPAEIQALPNVRSLGQVPSLRRALAAEDDGYLRGLVEAFAASGDAAERALAVRDLVYRLAGADQVSPGGRGGNMDARDLVVIEQILGEAFNGKDGPNPNDRAAEILSAVAARFFEIYYCELLYQTHLLPVRAELNFELMVSETEFDTAALAARLAEVDQTDPAGAQLVADVGRYLLYAQQAGVSGLAELSHTLGENGAGLYRDCAGQAFGARIGTEGADSLKADASHPRVYALAGNDSVTADNAVASAQYGGDGEDRLQGGADVLDGGPGDDRLVGGAGQDTYMVSAGSDVVDDANADSALVFPAGTAPSDVSITRRGSDAVFTHPGGEVSVYRWFYYGLSGTDHDRNYKLARVQFADGTVWDGADLTSWNGVGVLRALGPGFGVSMT